MSLCSLIFIAITCVNYKQFFYEIWIKFICAHSFFIAITCVSYKQFFFFLSNLIKFILILIKIISIDNRYFTLSYTNYNYLFQ